MFIGVGRVHGHLPFTTKLGHEPVPSPGLGWFAQGARCPDHLTPAVAHGLQGVAPLVVEPELALVKYDLLAVKY